MQIRNKQQFQIKKISINSVHPVKAYDVTVFLHIKEPAPIFEVGLK